MTAPSSDAQDQLDMARLAGGEDHALNELMSRHGERLFHYLVRSLQNEEEAADLAQETFVRVYQNRCKFRPGASFSTWLYAIASNLVRDRYRWRSRHPQVSLQAEPDIPGESYQELLPAKEPTPSEQLQAEERTAAIRKAIAALPEELRMPLILAEYEGRSQAEIGQILNCTAKAVETRIYRARKTLREQLAGLLGAE